MAATQTAAVVVGPPDSDILFQKTELGAEDTMCSQCGGLGSHWWRPKTWANGACRKLHICPENPLGFRPGEQRGACSHRHGSSSWDNEESYDFC